MLWHEFVYNIGFTIAFAITWPYFAYRMLKRGNAWAFIAERVGFYSEDVFKRIKSMRRPIWIHAVSVGEMMIAQVLVREIRAIEPDQEIVLTTTTQTGRQVGQKLVDDKTILMYNPADFLYAVHRSFQAIRPSVLVLVENEIWPNFIWCAHRRKIPVCLVNVRVSPRSFRRYRRFGYWVQPVLEKFSWFGVQQRSELDRLACAGFPAHRLFHTGSIKFDVANLSGYDESLAGVIREKLKWDEKDPVILAGSTHPGEEKLFIRIFKYLRPEYPNLRLVLAPRHVERAPGLLADCKEAGLTVVSRSQLNGGVEQSSDVFLLDTTGELRSLYPLGTINFIGKSILGKGGQNFIEAARCGRPVIVGPYMSNFSNLVEIFLLEKGLIQVDSELELYQSIRELLANPERCRILGRKAAEVFKNNLGAGKETAHMIMQTKMASKA